MAKKLKKRKAAKSIAVKKRVSTTRKISSKKSKPKKYVKAKTTTRTPKIPRSRKRTETKLLEKHEHGIREMIDQRKR
jgi:hypothetical protein